MSDAPHTRHAAIERLGQAPAVRLLLISGLIVVLLVPLFLVQETIGERSARHREAVNEVGLAWGRPQALVGPVLVVPYVEERRDSDGRTVAVRRRLWLFPERLEIAARLAPEIRYRGLFEAVVYRARAAVRAEFTVPDLAALAGGRGRVDPGEAFLAVGLSDPRSVDPAFVLQVDGAPVAAAPDRTAQSGGLAWLRASLPVGGAGAASRLAVAFEIGFNGSERLAFAPVGKVTDATLEGAWADPSFSGAFLPVERQVAADGFRARWAVGWFGRGYGETWDGGEQGDPAAALAASFFGTTLLQPVSPYRQVERAAKYGILFIVLTFAVYFLFETRSRVRIGLVAYGLVGLALCLFHVLLLALSEPLGFAAAYAAAAAAVVVQASGYTAAISRSIARGLLFGGLLAGLYGILYVLLGLESYALLLGAALLFAALSAVMWLTRPHAAAARPG